MPRYYFDFRNGDKSTLDDGGLELESNEAAEREAGRAVREYAADVFQDGFPKELILEVRDADKRPLFRTILRLEVERLQ